MANDSDMSGWSDLLHSSSKLLEQAAPSAQFPPLQRNLDQLESLSKKLKAKTLRTEAPSQSIAATRLLAREGINAEQLARDLKSFELKRGYTSPLKDSTSPNHSILPSSEPFIEANLPEKGFEDQATSIAQPVGESSSFQGVSPPNVESDEGPIDLSVGQEPIRSDKDKSSQAVKSSSGIIPPPFSKTTNESVHEDTYTMLRSIQDLFTSWEQVKASQTARSSSASRPSTASAVFSIENMNILKQAVLEYTSFMDMDISNASAASQQDKFERLSHQMAQALELPSLKLSTDLKLSLKIIHQEISVLLARNVELKAKKTQYVNAVIEKESLHQEINQAKNNLNEISSDVMVEDYLMMSLAAQMKEIQGKMDDCKARLAAKKRNASQKVERARFLFERYSSLEVDEGIMDELSTASVQQRDEWEKLREHMCSIWGKL